MPQRKAFLKMGAKVKRAGKKWAVTHGTTGEVLSRHSTEAAARSAARETRARNRFSGERSRRNRSRHGN